MEKKTVTLSAPVKVADREMLEIEIRRSTVGDEEDAMQQAVRMKRGDNQVTVEICLIAMLTRLPYDAVRSLYGPDYQKLRHALNELNGVESTENPTLKAGTE